LVDTVVPAGKEVQVAYTRVNAEEKKRQSGEEKTKNGSKTDSKKKKEGGIIRRIKLNIQAGPLLYSTG